jgi:hypothetical protein
VLLQEVQLRNAKDVLLASPFGFVMATAFLYADSNSPTGTAIGSRVKEESFQCLTTVPDVEPIVGTPKTAVLARYLLENTKTLVSQI